MVPSYSRRRHRRCTFHRHGAAAAATSPFCSQQQQSLCFPSLAIIEARGSLLLTCSYHRGSQRSSLHSSSRQKKKLGEHLLLQSWRRWTTVVCSVQAACKPAGRSRRRRVLPRAVVRGKGANGGGGDGGVAPVPSKLSRSWLFSCAYWAVQHMASRTSKSHRCLKAERERAELFPSQLIVFPSHTYTLARFCCCCSVTPFYNTTLKESKISKINAWDIWISLLIPDI